MQTEQTPIKTASISQMRVRTVTGGRKAKARPIMVMRPSLKEINAKIRAVRRQGRLLRGQLRRTSPLMAEAQMKINQGLERLKHNKARIMEYVGSITGKPV